MSEATSLDNYREAIFSGAIDQKYRFNGYAPDLDILSTFVRVAEMLSFTKAARALNKSQSTVSLHIKRIEEIYRCEMFRRSKRSVELTNDGEILLSYAQRMIGLHQSAQAHLQSRNLGGRLRVGIMEDFTARQLPQILKQFSLRYHEVEIELNTAVSAELMSGLEDGQLDVVLARRSRDNADGMTVWQESLRWVTSPDYEIVDNRPLPLVLFQHGCFYRPLVIEELDARGIPWTITCTSTSLAGVCAAVSSGFGITALAESTIPTGLTSPSSKLALPQLPSTEIAVFRSRSAQQEIADPFIEFVRDAFSH